MNPAGTLVRGAGSPDGATGTRATSGGVEPAVTGRGVGIHDTIENGRLRTTVPAGRLRLEEQSRMGTSPLDQRLCQRQHLGDRLGRRVHDFRRKRLIATLADDDPLFARLFQCARQNAIVQYSVFVRPILVDEIRVDRGKTLYPDAAGRLGGPHCAPARHVLRQALPRTCCRGDRACSARPLRRPLPPLAKGVEPPALRRTEEVAYRIPTRPNSDEMSLHVAGMEIDSAYGRFRWGFIRGILLGIRLGILLERHPLRPVKTPVSGCVGGSAGIPDSLGHKPVDTSGRTGGRLPALSAPGCACLSTVLFLPHFPLRNASQNPFFLCPCTRWLSAVRSAPKARCPRWPAETEWHFGRKCADVCRFGQSGMVGAATGRKES